jgi:ABC-2 type transport system permease protein
MKKIQKTKRILKKEIQLYFKKELQYRDLLIVRIFTDVIRIFTIAFVWLAVGKASGDISQGFIVTYYLLVVFVSRLMADYSIQRGPGDIITGDFNTYLIKPFSHLVEYFGIDIGYNLLRFSLALPSFILGIILVDQFWILEFNPYKIFLAILAMILGFIINFILGNIFTLVTFFTKEIDGLRIFYFNIVSVFSGEFIPLAFMSYGMRFASEILPFRYTLSFPIEIMIGNMSHYDIRMGFVIAVVWVVILFFCYKLLYVISVKRYEAEGI